ncbi:MAG: hypothetical protein M3P94_05065, partial [Chloroflexota bacterium]|nr:hypothetical protein [Chloroflexota bacterium]
MATVAPVYEPPVETSRTPRQRDGRTIAGRGLLYSLATFFALFAAVPFAWMLLTIFKANNDLYRPMNNPLLYN